MSAENHTQVSGSALTTKTSLQPQSRRVLLLQTMLGLKKKKPEFVTKMDINNENSKFLNQDATSKLVLAGTS